MHFEDMDFWTIGVVIVLWILTIICVAISHRHDNREVFEVFDNCNDSNAKYRYFVRMDVNPNSRVKFNFERNSITVRVNGQKDVYISTFNVQMSILADIPSLDQLKRVSVKMIINRKEVYPKWKDVALESSTQRGSLYLYDIEVIGIDTTDHFLIAVNKDITAATLDKLSKYNCQTMPYDPNSQTGRPSTTPSLNELSIIFYMTVNLTLLFCALFSYLTKEKTSSDPSETGASAGSDGTRSMAVHVVGALVAFVIEIVVLMVYRMYFVRQFWKTYGARQWNRICLCYIVFCYMLGVVAAMLTILVVVILDTTLRLDIALIAIVALNVLMVAVWALIARMGLLGSSQEHTSEAEAKHMPPKKWP